MRPIARQLHAVIALLFIAALLIQVWLAGRGVFESPIVFATHPAKQPEDEQDLSLIHI